MDVNVFVRTYPTLYHMAEDGTWASIKQHGLMSTSAILDRYGLAGADRDQYEKEHRPTKMAVGRPGDQIVLRDQKPMSPNRLAGALVDGTTPSQWYQFLNGRVFMWAQEPRLLNLLNARMYRHLHHDVLSIRTESLVREYRDAIWLCHMNSGNCFPMPFPRGKDIFRRIGDYPTQIRTTAPRRPVVEVVTDYGIPNIRDHVIEVRRMCGDAVVERLPL